MLKNNLWFLVFVFFMLGCQNDFYKSDFFISQPVLSPATADTSFDHAGVIFDFMNDTSKNIITLEVSFSVFDKATGRNPFYTSNYITSTISGNILPFEKRTFEISLDDKIHNLVPDFLCIDYFAVNKIVYEDGSVWNSMWIPSSSYEMQ